MFPIHFNAKRNSCWRFEKSAQWPKRAQGEREGGGRGKSNRVDPAPPNQVSCAIEASGRRQADCVCRWSVRPVQRLIKWQMLYSFPNPRPQGCIFWGFASVVPGLLRRRIDLHPSAIRLPSNSVGQKGLNGELDASTQKSTQNPFQNRVDRLLSKQARDRIVGVHYRSGGRNEGCS